MRKLIDENINTQKLLRIACLLLADIVIINLSAVAALLLRFELSPAPASEAGFMSSVISYMWLNTLVTVIIFWIFGLYNSLWEFAGVHELVRIALASACSGAAVWLGMLLLGLPVPRSYPFIYILVLFVAASFPRFIYRLLRNQRAASKQGTRRRTMLIGGGAAGAMVIREFQNSSHSENQVVCVIDDNPSKRGALLMGVPIVGDREKIESTVQKYGIEEIVLAIPSAQLKDRTELISICQHTGCRLKTLPALYQLANGEVSVKKVRDVDIVDLLGRATVDVDMSGIADYIKGKTVLVTGGGGSIGSELCRQIAKHGVGRLVIFDIYENNAYDIQQELKRRYPALDLVVLIGSVRDRKRVFNVMDAYRPELVFHAAAHKHVPLMEDSPAEAIKNNVFGTLNVAEAASEFGAKRFLLISTDKAVNPTNIMGASKRLCEMVVQSMNMVSHNGHTDWLPRLGGHRKETLDALHDNEGQAYVSENHTSKAGTGTEFVAVRFGNVLGSNGSVSPLFKRQIEKGGPVTVTHPDIIRYFMTIPEAVSLVLQAGTYAKGGEIFVLDMGAPVKIDTLARNLIKLSGYTPDVDIKVTYTGLRPGEKLYEEKLMAEEGMEKTPNDLIHIGKPIEMDVQEFFKQLEVLAAYGYANSEKIRDIVAAIVPTYHSADSDLKLHKKVYEELMSEAAVAAEKN